MTQRDYLKFKTLVNKMLEDDELKETIRAFFLEREVPTTNRIEMKPLNSEKNPLPESNVDSAQTFEEFIKAKMKEELGLVENPTTEQLQEIISKNPRKIKNKPKGKTVSYKDFINKISEDDIIDAEMV